jgi:hypothetical protein
MAKVNLSGPQREIIDVIAHVAVMGELDKNVEGMSGVLDKYINETMTTKERLIYRALQDRIIVVKKDTLRMAKEEWTDA